MSIPSRPASGARAMAVIEIGSTGLRLIAAQFDPGGAVSILDRAQRQYRLGRDVFTTGSVSRESIREAIGILNGFRELLRGYGIDEAATRVIATSALREAANRDTFVDKVAMRTGLTVDVIEDIEENHLMWLAVQQAMQDDRPRLNKTNSMILEVGGGSTEVMLLRRGRMVAAHSLRLGTVRIGEQARIGLADPARLTRYLEENVRSSCALLENELSLESVRCMVLVGSDARLTAARVGREAGEGYAIVDKLDFTGFVDSVKDIEPSEIVSRFKIGWSEAEDLSSGLRIARLFMERTAAEEIIVPYTSIREGVLYAMARGPDPEMEGEIRAQTIASAMNLGRKYRFDEEHAVHVAALALKLYDSLGPEHGMGRKERLLLEAAAILHDIGAFIKVSGHHRHSEYLISNSEIFGLNPEDVAVVASVARYHRKAPPASAHQGFMNLPREQRIVVLKLSAMLRVADALDRAHAGRIATFELERREDHYVIRPEASGDLGLERISLAEKGDLFEDVFGMKAVIG